MEKMLWIRVLFVCHGNICRSPMAEFILKDLVQKAGRAEEFEIASCATSRGRNMEWHWQPSLPACQGRTAETRHRLPGQVRGSTAKSDYDRYDYLIGMDGNNIRNMMRILGSDPEHKVHKLLDYTKRGGDVADPWYSARFDIAYRDVYEGCKALLEQL